MTDSLQIRSTVTSGGALHLALDRVTLADPGPGQLLVRVEAAPINPSDLGLMFGPADPATLTAHGTPDAPVLGARIPPGAMAAMRARLDQPLPVGNEGAGTVIAAGPDHQDLIGSRVAMIGGEMFATHRLIARQSCIVLPQGAEAEDGAALFVNPLTALGFVETMRRDGHSAIVHAPAASNLGQMLVRICQQDGVGLVNIVRSPDQVALLRGLGAEHVVDSSAETFTADLEQAIEATGATLAFDAIGGGETTSAILNAMEAVAARRMTGYDRYGSDSVKQVYVYGSLDTAPTILRRGFGFSWSVGGWLLFQFLRRCDADMVARLHRRVADGMTTTFASRYQSRITLSQALDPDIAARYLRKSTGEKYLIVPGPDAAP